MSSVSAFYPQEHDFANASCRLNALINQIILTAPGADLLVASVPPVTDPQANDRVMTFNAEIPAIVDGYVCQGEPVHFVDMAGALTADDLADGVHPNEAGYDKMAQVWHSTLSDLIDQHCENIPN
jgi:lysophospholipase L1-like esterase